MSQEVIKKKEMLRQVSLFEGLEDDDLDAVLPLLKGRKFVKNQPVMEAGTPGNSLFVVEKGRLKVVLTKGDKEVILSILKEGDFFGEMSLLDQGLRSATVIALNNSELHELQREDFLDYIETHPKAMLNILQALSERLRKADAIISDLTLLDVYGRVARLLLQLAKAEGKQTDDGIVLENPPSQQELAGMLGTSRETINRVISEFVRRGIIYKDGRQILLTCEGSLAEQFE